MEQLKQAWEVAVNRYCEVAEVANQVGSRQVARDELEMLEMAVKSLGAVLQLNGLLTTSEAFRIYGLELPTPVEFLLDLHER